MSDKLAEIEGERGDAGRSKGSIARETGLSRGTVSRIVSRQLWNRADTLKLRKAAV